jgi:hypothetical protein
MNSHDKNDATSAESQTARLDARLGRSPLHMRLKTTPAGLLAVGALVSSILLGVAVIVQSATSAKRRR